MKVPLEPLAIVEHLLEIAAQGREASSAEALYELALIHKRGWDGVAAGSFVTCAEFLKRAVATGSVPCRQCLSSGSFWSAAVAMTARPGST